MLRLNICLFLWFHNSIIVAGTRRHDDQYNHRRHKETQHSCLNDSDIVRALEMSGYNKHRIPSKKGPVIVTVEVWVQEISSISALTSDFKLDIYISEMWQDPGLEFGIHRPCKNNLTLTHETLAKIWTPNTCFINSKTAGNCLQLN